jgi:hypothetical protein
VLEMLKVCKSVLTHSQVDADTKEEPELLSRSAQAAESMGMHLE